MAMAAGAIFRIAGGITGGIAADQRRKRWEDFMNNLREPDPTVESRNWFKDLNRFYPQANKLSEMARTDEMKQNLALREMALPGYGEAVRGAMGSVMPMVRGELPAGVQRAFTRAGGASTVGMGMGGSGFGALNTGLFGARGSLGAIQTGMGLLPTILSTVPSVSAPTTMGLLGQLLTPMQRVNLQMQLRQQKIGMQGTLESMPTALDSWSAHLNESGAMLMGGGGASMGGGAGGGGGLGANGQPTSGWGSPGASPWIKTGSDGTKSWQW